MVIVLVAQGGGRSLSNVCHSVAYVRRGVLTNGRLTRLSRYGRKENLSNVCLPPFAYLAT